MASERGEGGVQMIKFVTRVWRPEVAPNRVTDVHITSSDLLANYWDVLPLHSESTEGLL